MNTYQKLITRSGQFLMLTLFLTAWGQIASAKAQVIENQTIVKEEVLSGGSEGEDSLKKNSSTGNPDRKNEKIKAKSIGKVKYNCPKRPTKLKTIWLPLALPSGNSLFY
jgi:hypothetical protein